MMERYNEQAVLLGQANSLVGVLARPVGNVRARRPAVVILNTGIIHRVGQHRMYVTMARQLAAAGHVVLRFDFSGIGDSRNRTDGLSPVAACMADVQDALDWLSASHDVSEAVLAGLCSGADIALRYGHTDPRVVGLMLLDPAIPPTARFYADYILRRMRRLRSWMTFASGGGRIWGDLVGRTALAIGTRPAAWDGGLIDPRTRSELEGLYRQSLERDIRLFVVLTGGDLAGRQTYREQLLDAFPTVPFEDKLRLEYFADSDHTFAPPRDRERLNVMIADWLAATPLRRADAVPSPEQGYAIPEQVRYGM
jgi:pimeloyl-ACP methyl ester carboxylesterase